MRPAALGSGIKLIPTSTLPHPTFDLHTSSTAKDNYTSSEIQCSGDINEYELKITVGLQPIPH